MIINGHYFLYIAYLFGMKKEENLPRKWEILFTIPNFNTAGSGKALLNIASRLDSKYFEPHIACLHDKGELFNEVKKSGIPIHVFQFTAHMEKRIAGFIQCWGISRYFKKINPHLIHSFHYAPDYSEALAARMAGVPWIYTKKNMNWGGKSKNGWKLRTRLAHHVICQNRSMLDLFFKDSKKTSMIPRGIDIKEFKMQPPNSDLLTQLRIASNDKVIITVANLAPVKGIELLLESFEIL
ncbi:uncharacterized protein METZ01_LOCUS426689 [marine metagenome]|uniref:Glycosyltransferase subfamily 4-like N-terminal domain-containing protein n=1 Tax=marine metagenome TaxID=408172 RepID=A0A382XT51_9ZZZZ